MTRTSLLPPLHHEEVEALLRRGLDYYGKDFFAEAEACWRQALALDPGDRRAIEYLDAMGVDPTSPVPPSVEVVRSSLRPPSLPAPIDAHKALVADGNAVQTKLARAVLRQGWDVLTATSCEAAVEIARATRPRLLLLAFWLPGGDAEGVLRALDGHVDRSSMVVLFTASALEAPLVRPRLAELGASLYIKPFERESLCRQIESLLTF